MNLEEWMNLVRLQSKRAAQKGFCKLHSTNLIVVYSFYSTTSQDLSRQLCLGKVERELCLNPKELSHHIEMGMPEEHQHHTVFTAKHELFEGKKAYQL